MSDKVIIRRTKDKKKGDKSTIFWENFNDYVMYYRLNPHRFCMEFLGIGLYEWQQFVLYTMWFKGNSIFLASRGTGKSWLTMVFCIAYCCLYPGSNIRVASANKKQAALLLAKVKEIQRNSPMVKACIKDIKIGKDEARIIFHGGSEVSTVVANDGARGERANVVIVDEREIVDKEIIDKVFIPFLTAKRKPPYTKKAKYKNFITEEQNHFIELSSIGSKTSSLYLEFEQYLKFISDNDKNYCTFSMPYQFGVSCDIISRATIEKMIKEGTTSIEAFKQEMEVIPSGDGEDSMLRYEDMNKNRKLHVPLMPITDSEFMQYNGDITKSKYYIPKNIKINEIRVIAMDVALMGGKENDNSIFVVYSLIPNGKKYIKNIVYIETMNGKNTESQVLRFKQLFYDLDCDFAVLDCGGVGQSLYDLCTNKTEDLLRNKTYSAWKNRKPNPALDDRVIDEDAEPLLFAIKISGASASVTHATIISRMRLAYEKKEINLLMNEEDIIEELDKRYKYNSLKNSDNPEKKEIARNLIRPFIETSVLIKECVYTQVRTLKNGGVEIDEKSGRKDRAMSMLYGFYFVTMLEDDFLRENIYEDNEHLVFY